MDNAFVVDLVGIDLADELTVTDDGDRVGDLRDLVQLVRNIDNDDILLFQLADHVEQAGHLMRSQSGGGFIKHQDTRPEAHGLGDLNDLTLPHAQVRDEPMRLDVGLHFLQEQLRLLVRRIPVDQTAALRQTAEKNILCDSQPWDQAHLLIYDGDPLPVRLTRAGE